MSIFDNLPDYYGIGTFLSPVNPDDQEIWQQITPLISRGAPSFAWYPSSSLDTRPLVWLHPGHCESIGITPPQFLVYTSLPPIGFDRSPIAWPGELDPATDFNQAILEGIGFNHSRPLVYEEQGRTEIYIERWIPLHLSKNIQLRNQYYSYANVDQQLLCLAIEFRVNSDTYGQYSAWVLLLQMENINALEEFIARKVFSPSHLIITQPGWGNQFNHADLARVDELVGRTNRHFQPHWIIDQPGVLELHDSAEEELRHINDTERISDSPSVFTVDYF